MIYVLLSLTAIVGTQVQTVQATEVTFRNHVVGGLVKTLEDAKSKSVLEVFQNRTVISGAVETEKENGNVKQPEIIRHWGFSHEHPFWGSPMLTAFLHYLSFAFVIKTMCMASNMLFQMSPLPAVKQFQEKQTTGETDAAPFVAIAFGGSQWCFYGVFAYLVTSKSGFLVLVYSNFLGALLGVYYVMTFHKNCTLLSQISGLSMYYRIVSAIILLQVGAMAVMPQERALFFSGLISSTCSIAQSLSGLATLPLVIKTKCAKSIPLNLCAACGISNLLWVTCGLMLWDPWIICPNVVGVLGSLVGIGLHAKYGVEEKLDLKDDQDPAPKGSYPMKDKATPRFEDDSLLVRPCEYSDLLSQHGVSDQELGVQHENYGSCADAGTGGT